MPSNLDLAGTNPLTPPVLAASQNDWGPDSSAGASTWYVAASTAVNLTGIAGGTANRLIRLVNIGAYTITLKSQSSSSLAANRFLAGADVGLDAGEAISLVYVSGSSVGWSALDAGAGAASAANLSIASRTSTTLDVASSSGTAATVPFVTTSLAGLMLATDKVKVDAVTGTNTGDQTVAGSTGYLQYKGSGNALDATSGLAYSSGSTLLTVPNLAMTGTATITANSSPSTPASGKMALWSQTVGGRILPLFKGPLSADTMIQPSLASGKVSCLQARGCGDTTFTYLGYSTVSTAGTLTGRNLASTNPLTRAHRISMVSSASAGNMASIYTTNYQMSVGTGTRGVGGFYKVIRFGCSDAATVAGARQFVGIANSFSAPTNVEPSSLTNSVGVGHGAADTNLKIYYGGSAAQTPLDLGSNFPANTLTADLYELTLFAPSTSGDVYYQVLRVNTGDVATGTITNSGATVLPASTTMLNCLWCYRTNNATALAVGFDFVVDCLETDV